MSETIAARGLEPLLREIGAAKGKADPALLTRLVDHLRPRDPDDAAQAAKNLQALQFLLSTDESMRAGLHDYFLRLFADHQQVTLYADLGILPDAGFFTELWRRIAQKILPAAIDPTALKDVLGSAFHRVTDHRWVQAIDDAHWHQLFRGPRHRLLRRRPRQPHGAPAARRRAHPVGESRGDGD